MQTTIVPIDKYHSNGILTTPEAFSPEKPIVLFINAGIIDATGPNRLYVNLSRGFAQCGYASFRFNFFNSGYYELDKNLDYDQSIVAEIAHVVSIIEKQTGGKKIILLGLCSGGTTAFRAALSDSRIVGIIPINANVFDPGLPKGIIKRAKENRQILFNEKKILSEQQWLRLISGKSDVYKKLFKQTKRNQSSNTNHQEVQKNSDKLIEVMKLKQCFLIFCEGDLFYETFRIASHEELSQLKSDGEINYSFQVFKGVDHTFTPRWSQAELSDHICEFLLKRF
ncbi:MAG: hypothetical protein R8G66_22025 [Cytophagales bacterium]|nr:hypothetical protein [Cytophagales bacterium]